MPSILVQKLDLGLDAMVSNNMIDPRGAAQGTENILYEHGIMTTPYGFAKVDLTTTGLNSGDKVLSLVQYTEQDRTAHTLAVTTEKIYDHNTVAESWDDKSGSAASSDIFHPVSYVPIAHNDTDIYLNDNSAQSVQYYHLIVCDGGLSNIQRWAGKYETTFHDVAGAGGYHDGTTHRALQVGAYKTRLILVSPLTYSSSSKSWSTNKQRIQWPVISKLQTWTGTGSGFVDLVDAGGENVWSAPLGSLYMVYQNNSIWELGYVGGTSVFSPRPVIPDLGLLAPHLLAIKGNVHYLVGNDYNVYAYYGGSVKQKIGDKIHKFLQDDLDPVYENRCWMAFGEEGRYLYIFIVPNGSAYITKAYIMNATTGAWSVRDFSNTFGSGDGITAVSLAGSQTYTAGDTYQNALNTLSAYDSDLTGNDVGDTTIRYGDVLRGDTTVNVIDQTFEFSDTDAAAGGLTFDVTVTEATAEVTSDFAANTIMRIDDGSDWANAPYGTHYYTITDVSHGAGVNDFRFTVAPRATIEDISEGGDSTGTGIADNSDDVPSIDATYSITFFDPSGYTYSQKLDEVQVAEKLMLGDATGFVYQMDETHTAEDSNSISARHLTPVIDLGEPGGYARWNKLSYTAKEKTSGFGGVRIRFRTVSFDTSETGWVDVDYGPTYDIGSDCVGHWRFDDNAASTAVLDARGQTHNGTASVNTNTLSGEGRLGRALNMGGTAYVTIPDHADFQFNSAGANDLPFSISAWVYVTAVSAIQTIIAKYIDEVAGTAEYLFRIFANGTLGLYLADVNAGKSVKKTTNAGLSAGWHHVVSTYSGTNQANGIRLFVDNVEVAATADDDAGYVAMQSSVANVTIGAYSNVAKSNKFQDKIDNVMIFSTELSTSEVSALYNNGVGPPFLASTTKLLGSDWLEYDAYINRSSKKIQFCFENDEGSDFEMREAELYFEREGNR